MYGQPGNSGFMILLVIFLRKSMIIHLYHISQAIFNLLVDQLKMVEESHPVIHKQVARDGTGKVSHSWLPPLGG